MAPETLEPAAIIKPEPLATFLSGQGSFLLSFIVGAVVIALYARKRIEEFSLPPRGEEYDFTKMLPMNTIVGQDTFYRSYFFYVLFLEFLFVFVCTSKPLVLVLTGDSGSATFQGAAWPLGAALIVVGILPSTPAVTQIEAMLRGLAQRVANIPSDFLERVSKLSRSEVEKLLKSTPDYKPEIRKFWKIHNQLLLLGFAQDDARLMARSCLAIELFGQWTVYGSRHWTAEEYDKYRDIVSVLRPKSELLRKETESLLVSWPRPDALSELWEKYKVSDPSSELPTQTIEMIVDDAEKSLRGSPEVTLTEDEARDLIALTEAWKKLSQDCEVAAKRLIALFAIIARNDRQTVKRVRRTVGGRSSSLGKSDPVVSELIQLLEETYQQPQAWSNAAILASLTGAVACLVVMGIYFHAVELFSAPPSTDNYKAFFLSVYETLKAASTTTSIKDSLFLTLTISASFCLASLTALFLRSVKLDDGEWVHFVGFRKVTLSNYYRIIFWSTLAAFMPLVIFLVLYYYQPSTGDFGAVAKAPPEQIFKAVAFKFLLAFPPVAYAIGTCILADAIEQPVNGKSSSRTRLCIKLTVAVAFMEFICLIVDPIYIQHTSQFWDNMIGVTLFAYVSFQTFFGSYKESISGVAQAEHAKDSSSPSAKYSAILRGVPAPSSKV